MSWAGCRGAEQWRRPRRETAAPSASTGYCQLCGAQSGDVAAPSPSLKLLSPSVCMRFCRSSSMQADTLSKPSSPSQRYLPVMVTSSSGKFFSRDMENRPDTSSYKNSSGFFPPTSILPSTFSFPPAPSPYSGMPMSL